MTGREPSPVMSPVAGFYQRLCEHAAIAMVATDADFNIIFWNAAARRLLGRSAEEMIGRPIDDVVPEHRRKLLRRLLTRTARRREPSQFEVRLLGDAGNEMHLMVALAPICNEQDVVEGISAWVMDETESKHMADQLAKSEHMASLGRLAGGVAHHFNNILGGLATYVDYAQTSRNPAAVQRALQMAAEASARAASITESLLSFAEHGRGGSDLADLTEVLLTFGHLMEKPLADRGIRLRLDLQPVPVVPVQSRQMHRTLGHLLSNAEEAMPNGGSIEIVLQRRGGEVALTFADTGEGIPPARQRLIFDPIFTTKGLHAGGDKSNPGLGLSVVHGIIEEMGGRIDVDSRPGEGTTLILSLPVPDGEKG